LRRITVAIAVVLVAIATGAPSFGSAEPSSAPVPVTHPAPKKKLRNGCAKLFSQKQFKHYARRVYTRKTVTYTARRQMVTMTRCQHSPKAERKMRRVRKQLVEARKQRAWLAALTPYGPCYGGMWAVPCEIIGGEAGGSWTTANAGGCVGPYQFCGWKVPWPIRTLWDKIRHHMQAAKLWRGGAGCSHWEQTSSAC
jgi:hypothetical protein